MAESNHNPTIIAAIIGVIGSIGVAIIANWDKLNGYRKPEEPTPIQSTMAPVHPPITPQPPPAVPTSIDISGDWYNPAAPAAGSSHIEQQNDSFQFSGWGMMPQGIRYETQGSGNLAAQNLTYAYTALYQNGWVSQGSCNGTVTANGSRITATCSDTILGTFVSAGVRQ